MSTKRSRYTAGMGQTPVPVPNKAGEACSIIVSHTFTEDVNSTDVLDLISLGPNTKVVFMRVITENVGAINLKVGHMTGTPGSPDAARTCGAEYFAAQAANAAGEVPLLTLANLASVGETPVSIGVQPAANIVAGATKKLHLQIDYIPAP